MASASLYLNERIPKAYLRPVLYTLFSYVTFRMSLGLPAEKLSFPSSLFLNTIYSFRRFELKDLLLLAGLWLLFSRTAAYLPREKKAFVLIPSLLFAFFMVFGYSFEATDSWKLALGLRSGQLPKAAFVFVRWSLLFYHSIAALFHFMETALTHRSKGPSAGSPTKISFRTGFRRILADPRFRISLLVLLIGYIPRMIVAYPAVFMADSVNQIAQSFPELRFTWSVSASRLLSDSVFINQHHPVAHTLFIHECLVIGDSLFHSFNAGAVLYTVLQNLFFYFTIALPVTLLCRRLNLRRRAAVSLSLYFVLHPLIHCYISLITKDVIYMGFFLLFMLLLFLMLENQDSNRSPGMSIAFILSCMGMIMFRNEAKYVIILSLFVLLFLWRPLRRAALAYIGFLLVFSTLYFNVLMPAMHFTEGSVREMLSVPFQQTARYVKYHEESVSEEEREAISAVLNYDVLADRYDPDLSDPVKNTFNQDASPEELAAYFRSWKTGLLKQPGTYVQATMNNYYQFFYPGQKRVSRYTFSWSGKQAERLNGYLETIGRSFTIPTALESLRKISDEAGSLSGNIPVFSLLMTPALYTWSFILMAIYSLRTGNRRQFLILVPMMSSQLCFLLGPANGYYGRYSFPASVFFPFCILMFILMSEQAKDAANT